MHYQLVGSTYVIEDESGNKIGSCTVQQFPFVVQVGDTVERFGVTKTVSGVYYMENGSVVIETSEVSK